VTEFEKKKPLSEKEENAFYWQLRFRFYSSVLRGHIMGHKRPLSSARDYLHFQSLKGADREASEFLVDVANMGRPGGLNMEELHRKWALVAEWHPGGRESARLQVLTDEQYEKRETACELCIDPIDNSHIDEDGTKRWRACTNPATRQVLDNSGKPLNVCEEHFKAGRKEERDGTDHSVAGRRKGAACSSLFRKRCSTLRETMERRSIARRGTVFESVKGKWRGSRSNLRTRRLDASGPRRTQTPHARPKRSFEASSKRRPSA